MGRKLPPFAAVRAFEAAARHMSVKAAAEELCLTPSAVSHQIKGLEARIGQTLFRRDGKALNLTEAGGILLRGAQSAFGHLSRAMDALHALNHSPVLTVSVPPSVAMKWLVPRLETFRNRHSDIDVRISTDIELPSLIAGDVDIAVHYGNGDYPGLTAELLVANSVAPMCSPKLCHGDPPLRRPEDLRHFTLLHDIGGDEAGNPAYDWGAWLARHGVADVDATLGLRFNTSADVLNAAVAGVVSVRIVVAGASARNAPSGAAEVGVRSVPSAADAADAVIEAVAATATTVGIAVNARPSTYRAIAP